MITNDRPLGTQDTQNTMQQPLLEADGLANHITGNPVPVNNNHHHLCCAIFSLPSDPDARTACKLSISCLVLALLIGTVVAVGLSLQDSNKMSDQSSGWTKGVSIVGAVMALVGFALWGLSSQRQQHADGGGLAEEPTRLRLPGRV